MRITLILFLLAGLIVIGCNGNDQTNLSMTSTPKSPEATIPDILDAPPLAKTPSPTATDDQSDETLFSQDGPVSVILTSDQLTITNNTPDIVYYYVWPVNLAGLIDWYPCENLEQCAKYNSIAAGKDIQIGIQKNATDLILYWWKLVNQPDGTTSADSVNEILIEIP